MFSVMPWPRYRRGRSGRSLNPSCSLGIPTATRAPSLAPPKQGQQLGMDRWVQQQEGGWMLLAGGLQMHQGEGKSLSKLPCRMRHIPLHLLALGFCLGTCPVPGGGRAGEPSPLHPTGWVCKRGRECVCVCVFVHTYMGCQLSALP